MHQSPALKFMIRNAQKLKEFKINDESFDFCKVRFELCNVTGVDMALSEAQHELYLGGQYLYLKLS